MNQKAADALADPTQYENLFSGLKEARQAQDYLQTQRRDIPASKYPAVPVSSHYFSFFLRICVIQELHFMGRFSSWFEGALEKRWVHDVIHCKSHGVTS